MPPRCALDIRWSTRDPDALAARLRGYGFDLGSGRVLAFPSATVGIDAGAGPADHLEIADGPAALPAADPHPNGVVDLLAIGWATVDRERFLEGLGPGPVERLARDPHLGAFVVRHSLARPQALVLEPDTEGRLAASLARSGEGPAAIYVTTQGGLDAFVADTRRRSAPVSSVRPGPFGPSVVLLDGPLWGPHVLVVGRPSGGTISA
jgi:hypothetical protein